MKLRNFLSLSSVPLLLAGLAVTPATAHAETDNCMPITRVPAVISVQGVYCFTGHVQTSLASGNAITVTVNNVTIDCNDYKLGNLANGAATQAVGIYANERLNLTVRNCGIRGFRTGMLLTDGLYEVIDNRLDQNTQTALDVSGDGSLVRGNQVVATGDSTLPGLTSFAGIVADGDVDVIDNNITDVVATGGSNGTVYGIFGRNNDAGFISDNRIRNLAKDGSGLRRGIWNENSRRVLLERNVIVLDDAGLLADEAAIRCGDSLLVFNGAARDNTILGGGVLNLTTALLNCTAISGNYVNPL